MRRFWVSCGVSVLGLLLASTPAAAQFYQQRSQASPATPPGVNHLSLHKDPGITVRQATHPHHTIATSPPPSVVPRHQSTPPQSTSPQHSASGRHHANSVQYWLFWGGGYPLILNSGYTSAFGAYYSPYPYFATYPYPYFAPQVFNNVAPAPLPNQAAVPRNLDPDPDDEADKPPAKAPRASNAPAKAKAGRFIGFGDGNFSKQNYLAAVERYRTAAEAAPDLPEPFFRQAYALVAMGQYESATKAFRRGLKIRSDWTDSPFRLDQIYGGDQLAKTSHLENLARALEANPFDSDLLVALGLQLYFDGQRNRAGVFLARAAQLGANDDKLLNDFLAKPAPAGAGAQPDKPGGKIVF